MLPSSWANLMTSACWALTARIDDLLLAGERGAGRPVGRGGPGRPAAAGGSSVPRTCMPWRSSLTLVLLRPGDDREGVVGRVDGDDRELVGLEADDHVDVVAGLDDRADAGDLVDLDRHGSAWSAGSRCRDLARLAAGQGAGRDGRAGGDGLADDLADDLGHVAEGVRVAAGRS